jgi:hypothetical protein
MRLHRVNGGFELATGGTGTAYGLQAVGEESMTIDLDTISYIDALTREQERILANVSELPPTNPAHISIAVFEGWADGLIDDSAMQEQMSQHCECARCEDNYIFYKQQREQNQMGN